jgi:hypothetical protein
MEKLTDQDPLDAFCMNALYATTKVGTLGELIVQLRLLENDIQAAPPIKDSGNDLIAIRGEVFRAIQVRATTCGTIDKPLPTVKYDILAVVEIPLNGGSYSTRAAEVFLFEHDEVAQLSQRLSDYRDHVLSPVLLEKLFSDQPTAAITSAREDSLKLNRS